MKRTPLQRKTELKAKTSLRRKTPLRLKSKKARRAEPLERSLSRATLDRDVICRWPGCVIASTDAHHMAPKSLFPHLRHDPCNLVGLCRWHHRHLDTADGRQEARALKLFYTRADGEPPCEC